jgi:ATP-dependent Clp protease ATP-binding subunit ClpC
MFERFTERARRCIFFANQAARQYGAPSIESEFLLLGILREDRNIVRRFVPNLTADPRQKVEQWRRLRRLTSQATCRCLEYVGVSSPLHAKKPNA